MTSHAVPVIAALAVACLGLAAPARALGAEEGMRPQGGVPPGVAAAPCEVARPSPRGAAASADDPPPILVPAPVDRAPEHSTMPFTPTPEVLAAPPGPWGALLLKRLSFVSIHDLPEPMRRIVGPVLAGGGPARIEVDEMDAGWPRDTSELLTPAARAAGRGRQQVQPRDLGASGFAAFQFLGYAGDEAAPGDVVNSVERYFRREDGVVIVLREWNYACGAAAIFVIREMLNAKVGSHPGVLSVETSPGGRVRSSLTWQDSRSEYRITVLDDVDREPAGAGRYGREWLLGLAASLGT